VGNRQIFQRKKFNSFNFIFHAIFIISILTFQSCSLIDRTRRSLLGEDVQKKSDPYLTQYKSQSEKGSTAPVSLNGDSASDEMPVVSSSNETSDMQQQGTPLVIQEDATTNKMSEAREPQLAGEVGNWVVNFSSNGKPQTTDLELQKLQEALNAYVKKDWNNSLALFSHLLQAQNDQVRVRSIYYSGKIWVAQLKFDLALQQFERVIEKHAYSSLSLLALKEAAHCAEKLGSKEKALLYSTALQDYGIN